MINKNINFLGDERKMRHVFTHSKSVAYASYDILLSLLLVVFHNGREYEYYGVDQDTWNEFIQAKSAGTFFNTVLRKFKYQRIK